MKRKLYYLVTVLAVCGMLPHVCLALPQQQDEIVTTDTLKKERTVQILVQDWATSKPLDSVRVAVGKESKFTKQGKVILEIRIGGLVHLHKPGYSKVSTTISSEAMVVKMMKTEDLLGQIAPDFTKASTTISGDAIRNVSANHVMEGLRFYVPSLLLNQNKDNGSNPNAPFSVALRGMNNFPFSVAGGNKNVNLGLQVNPSAGDYKAASITSAGSPIFLLDGIQVPLQTIQDLDMNRIADISILKDAASTAIYGMRGGNGVIAVQTIKPQSKFQISFTEQVNLVTPDLSSFKRLSAKDQLAIDKASGYFDGDLAAVYQERYNQAYNNNVNTDWLAIPVRNAVGTKHSLGLNAGNDDVVYGLTASYNDIQGVMKGSDRKILDLGAYFGGRIGSLIFNNQFSYIGVDASDSPYGTFDSYTQMNPYWSPIDPFTNQYQKIVEGYTVNGITTTVKNPAYNTILSTTDEKKYTRFSNLTNLSWIIGHGFQLNGTVGLTRQTDQQDYFLPPNHTVFADVTADNLFKRGFFQHTSNSFWDVQGTARLQYQYNSEKHQLHATLGQTLNQTSSESERVEVSGFAVDRLAEISFGSAYSIAKPISGKINTRYASSFTSMSYNYDKRYQLDLSAALDFYSGLSHSSIFGVAGATWNMHEENFMKQIDWLDQLKIRASIGTSGNQDFLSYLNRTAYRYYTNQQYIPIGSGAGTIGQGLGAYRVSQGNHDLESPMTFKRDIGITATLFRNRLSLSAQAFRTVNSNMILPMISTAVTGYQNFAHYANYGKLETKGVEFGVNIRAVEAKNNLKLDVIANAYRGTDKIMESGPYLEQLNAYYTESTSQKQPQAQYTVGYAPYAIWAVPSKGIDPQTGQELFLKKDGSTTTVWDAADKVYTGNWNPKWIGNLGFNLSYSQFSFATYFNFSQGASVYNQTMADLENTQINTHLDGRALSAQRWTVGQADANYKALFHSPTYVTSRLVEKDNRFSCSSISLGYQFPKRLVEHWNIQGLGVKTMVNNAFELGGADMQRGTRYPFQRQYTFLIHATF